MPIALALGSAGLTRETAKIDETLVNFYRQGEYPQPLYQTAFADPWRFPEIVRVNLNELTMSRDQAFKSLSIATRLSGFGSRRDLLGDPAQVGLQLATQPNSLMVSLGRMKERGLIAGEIPPLSSVPLPVQEATSLIINMALDTVEYRGAAFNKLPSLSAQFSGARESINAAVDPVGYRNLLDHYRLIDLHYLFAASQDMASGTAFAVTHLAGVSESQSYSWSIKTGWGEISLSGGMGNTYDGTYFLIIDTGGSDTYINAPTNKSLTNWASVVVDLAGNDQYLSSAELSKVEIAKWAGRNSGKTVGGPGSATFGVSYLVDGAGDDLYRSHRPAFGSATFGVAMHLDQAGNDIYDTYVDALGYGKFGIGMIEDVSGDDQYKGFSQVQGVGITAGVGILVDRAGNDTYSANDAVIDFPSPQTAEHNVSMSQGAGYGLRMDYVNGQSLSGGTGMLIDFAGQDQYSCGVFGQGVGYWMGTGILLDREGKDSYKGQWYVQGASAHFGIGYLEDIAGDDIYHAAINMAQGAGHDFGYGYLIERAGDDQYQGAGLSLGAGNANGVGIFFDIYGTDSFAATGDNSMGRAQAGALGSIREQAFSLGLFFDGYGPDTYAPGKSWTKNGNKDVAVVGTPTEEKDNQIGIFFDR